MNLEDLSIDELDAMSIELKNQIEDLRKQRQEIKRVREVKAVQENIQRQIDASGLQGIIVAPTPAEIKVRLFGEDK